MVTQEFPLHLNRTREKWDVYIGLVSGEEEDFRPSKSKLSVSNFQYASISAAGLDELVEASDEATAHDLSDQLRVRVIESTTLPSLPQRESLATASRFAQLFMWMIQSRHPLFLFGIPGIVLFVLGYRLSGGVVATFTELSTESIGVTLLTIAMTLFGLFAMMIALILYIMGKQVEQVQAQYDGPRGGPIRCKDSFVWIWTESLWIIYPHGNLSTIGLESTTTSRSIFTTRGFLMNGTGLNSILHSSKIVGEINMIQRLLMPIYVHVWRACR